MCEKTCRNPNLLKFHNFGFFHVYQSTFHNFLLKHIWFVCTATCLCWRHVGKKVFVNFFFWCRKCHNCHDCSVGNNTKKLNPKIIACSCARTSMWMYKQVEHVSTKIHVMLGEKLQITQKILFHVILCFFKFCNHTCKLFDWNVFHSVVHSSA